jgi:CRP/FNR family cyclic AMP-dependent transcriptional regulator
MGQACESERVNASSSHGGLRGPLSNVTILAGLEETAITFLSERMIESASPAGAVIVREGETGNRFFFVGEGSVRVCKHFGQANECELTRLKKGDFFGEMCILETLPRSATVQAVSDTTVFSLTSLAFYHFYEAMPSQYGILLLNIARDLSRRLRRLDEEFAAKH